MKTKDIDIALVRSLFSYDKDTGVLYRLSNGEVAGHINKQGYVIVKIGRAAFKAHRIIYCLVTGEQPEIIDHINQNKKDNRWCNLRNVSFRVNLCNNSRKIANTGFKSVHKSPYGKYIVQLAVKGKYTYFGSYEDLELADLVAREARIKYNEVPDVRR